MYEVVKLLQTGYCIPDNGGRVRLFMDMYNSKGKPVDSEGFLVSTTSDLEERGTIDIYAVRDSNQADKNGSKQLTGLHIATQSELQHIAAQFTFFLTFTIDNSVIVDSNNRERRMYISSIDLVVLGIVLEKPQSAYDIQKDVEYHNLSKWTKISVPSIYRKVIQLKEKGYLGSDVVIANLNKVSASDAVKLISKLRESIKTSDGANEDYAIQYAEIPLVGRTIFEQQKLLYHSLLEWLDNFEAQMSKG